MDKNEVITLSSDDETETREDPNTATVKQGCTNFPKFPKSSGVIVKNNRDGRNKSRDDKQIESKSNDSPEVVDVIDFLDNLDEDCSYESDQNSDPDIIDLEENSSHEENAKISKGGKLLSNKIDTGKESITGGFGSVAHSFNSDVANEEFNQNLKFFTEFVEYCGSLEKNPDDRVRLTRKLMKRYGEADCGYIKSREFKHLIDRCREKIGKNNLYLIAKEITEELSFKKEIGIGADKSNAAKEISEKDEQKSDEKIEDTSDKLSEKRLRFINKIVKKLDKLGSKIRELEEEEVDLSDEESSTYILLQRYRERFYQIYKRLCAYTHQIPDPNNRKICFTESKYPAINKCIENWLNKTKRFPDFLDIMKLLESQSSSLNLPSNKDVVRSIAVEIFQKVGVMLQRRRIYDLWDILCGFLDDGKDPAENDPNLDETLKNNFETRLKKEQEIFQHFAELQEKEKLEPEEVADDEANNSPIESGSEDDKEIEEIENSLNKRVDEAIKNGETSGNLENKDYDGNENNSENESNSTPLKPKNTVISKETKNNYRNCKSLKWRQENSGKTKTDTSISEDSSTGTENDKDKSENCAKSSKDGSEQKEKTEKCDEVGKDDSDLELIAVEETTSENSKVETGVTCSTVCKRVSSMKLESPHTKKKKLVGVDFDVFDIDDENEKTSEVFGVYCCQIFPDNIFQEFREEEKNWTKRKVFRDLTNVNRLMELHGKRKKMSGLFSPSFFHRSFCQFEKSSWKKRFKVSFRLVGSKDEKCALNQEEKSTKTANSDSGGDSDEKDIQSNSEGGGDEDGDNFFRSHGNGSEGDNNEDENKKSDKTTNDFNENQNEEEEDEEDEEKENEKADNLLLINTESLKQFLSIKKTEELSDYDKENKASLEIEKCSDENKELIQLHVLETKTPNLSLENDNEMKVTEICDKLAEVNENEKEVRVEESKDTASEYQNEETAVKNSISEKILIGEAESDAEKTETEIKNYEVSEESYEETVVRQSETVDVVINEPITNTEVRESKEESIEPSGDTTANSEFVEVIIEEIKAGVCESKSENIELNSEQKICSEEIVTEGARTGTEVECKAEHVDSSVKMETNIETEDILIEEVKVRTEGIGIRNNKNNRIFVKQMGAKTEAKIKVITPKEFNNRVKNPKYEPGLEMKNQNHKSISPEKVEVQPTIWPSIQLDLPIKRTPRRNTPSPTDEERVKRFLMHSPSSISITPPKKLTLSKPPSQSALQALATLRNLKGISATIVRSKPTSEDDVVIIGGSAKRHTNENSHPAKRRRTELPVISNVQSIIGNPKIVTVQGNVSSFNENIFESRNPERDSSSLRISSVWGNLPCPYTPIPRMELVNPGCSSKQSENIERKKTSKKTVEYVVLD